MSPPFVAIALAAAMLPLASCRMGPGGGQAFHGKHVIIFGVDGLRPDALLKAKAPVMQGLAKAGTATMNATAGGDPDGPTRQRTTSAPGWTTILTGTYVNKHGVIDNRTRTWNQHPAPVEGSYQVATAPHFAKRLKESVPSARVVSITSWPWIEDCLVAAQPQDFARHGKGRGADDAERDADVSRQALGVLGSRAPDVLFLHYLQVDVAGHASGFTPANPDYVAAVETVDGLIGRVVDAVARRSGIAKEDWLLIVVSDHGGVGRSHRGHSPQERTIPLIVAGKGSSCRGIIRAAPGQHVVPATVFGFFGVPVKKEWGWEPGTFGLK